MTRNVPALVLLSAFTSLNTVYADNVEIYLVDLLDNTQNGYCIDIARAQGEKANPDDGLQGHTCYSPKGELMVDQIFDTEKFAEGLLFMPEFDVCANITEPVAGASVGLSTCDGSDSQSFVFSGEGMIVPQLAPELCVTVAESTRTGKSDVNQIKVLSLEACSEEKAAYQMWSVRESL